MKLRDARIGTRLGTGFGIVVALMVMLTVVGLGSMTSLPPMRGKRVMVMSPAGGFTVMMADLCEQVGFEFADPGREFYEELKQFSNAGVINFSNPLDMGDIYDPYMFAHILFNVMHSENVDAAVYVSQWPHMPRGEDVFYKMFHTDLSQETIGTLLSSGKPIGICLFGLAETISRIKRTIGIPLFENVGGMIRALKKQYDYYQKKSFPRHECALPGGVDLEGAAAWLKDRSGVYGEEALELLSYFGITAAPSRLAGSADDSALAAETLGFPVVLKVVSPDAVHKSEAGGVIVGLRDAGEVRAAFTTIRENLCAYKKDADFQGVRVMKMASEGYDMFIGGNHDESFGPVVFFGLGGIYIEVFRDVKNVLCPAYKAEIEWKVRALKSAAILAGARGKGAANLPAYIDLIERVTHLLSRFPEIRELDLNPVRLLEDGSAAVALDARILIRR